MVRTGRTSGVKVAGDDGQLYSGLAVKGVFSLSNLHGHSVV